MDGRESARPPHDDRPRRRAAAREPLAGPRRLATPRLLLTSGAIATVIAALLAGPRATRSLRTWLHDRPEHRLAFRAIELVPPPPPWIFGGSATVLDRVRAAGRWPESLATLDVAPDALRKSFVLDSPWVAEARVRVSSPNQVRIEVTYREPVARVQLGNALPRFVIDGSAVVLPATEVDPGVLAGLPIVRLPPGTALGAAAPGSEPGPGGEGLQVDDGPARSAAALAVFLRAHRGEAVGMGGPLNFRAILAEPSGIWLQNEHRQTILWEKATAPGRPGELDPEARWAMLRAWAAGPPADRSAPTYRITPRGVVAL